MNGKERNLRIVMVAAIAAATAVISSNVNAAEIRLIDRVTVEPGIVQLGDIAELYGAPEAVTDRLAAIDLFPAPSSKGETVVTARRVIDVLARRGLNFNEHRISGASRVTLVPAIAPPARKPRRSPAVVRLEREDVEEIQATIEKSIVRLLRRKMDTDDVEGHGEGDVADWQLEFTLSPQQAALIHQSDGRFSVSGGVAPYTGRQQFEVVAVTAEEEVRRFAISVDVQRPRLVVVAEQNLPRGTVILESDVRLAAITDARANLGAATRIDEIVGKETTSSIRAGKPIPVRSVREPILVRRGEKVTVIALSGGIRVQTQGKARQDGSLNQLIAIETIDKRRKSFQARVSNLQEVEVYAGAVATR